ncbi:hypothetical protein [Nostoc sp. CALU 1950]|uniref:hypothetical protein n=1 Tax=Nostoc sp. CALU 1950 TaxID=3104321 RepID=UPI003EC12922
MRSGRNLVIDYGAIARPVKTYFIPVQCLLFITLVISLLILNSVQLEYFLIKYEL